MSLVEVMIATTIVSILGLGVMKMMDNQNKSVLGIRTMSSRDTLKSLISRYTGDPKALKKSADFPGSGAFPANTALKNCVSGTAGPSGCSAAGGGLTLLDPSGMVIAGPGDTTPARFDTHGAPCTTAGPMCPLIATTRFTADCGEGATNCETARSITIHWALKQAPGVLLAAGPPLVENSGSVTSSIPLQADTSGAVNRMARWISSTQLGTSEIHENPASGNVGVGSDSPGAKLDVAGELRIGNSGVPCTGANAGAIRHNSGSQRLEYCSNGAWSSMVSLKPKLKCTAAYRNGNNPVQTIFGDGNAVQPYGTAQLNVSSAIWGLVCTQDYQIMGCDIGTMGVPSGVVDLDTWIGPELHGTYPGLPIGCLTDDEEYAAGAFIRIYCCKVAFE